LTSSPAPETCGGFHKLRRFNIKDTVVKSFIDLNELTTSLSLILDRKHTIMPNVELGDVCYLVQHRLLSLPEAHDPLESIFSDDQSDTQIGSATTDWRWNLYFLCRWTALLFTIHTTYAIARSRNIRDKLLPRVHAALKAVISSQENVDTYGIDDILLWCAIVGSIASQDCRYLAYRSSFESQFRTCQISLGLQSWGDARQILKSFAWIGEISDPAGHLVWDTAILSTETFCLDTL
jgi:hypothetical protein